MNKILNPTAGIANPFWYEWLVGLLHVLDMLNSDNRIKSVTLQASKLQGLDDVVINYEDGNAKCIQVKNTRENDTLTFSDMIRNDSGKRNSYIYRFSSDWLSSLNIYSECKAVLFTNRSIGKRIYKVNVEDNESYERPALHVFWPYVKEKLDNTSSLDDIVIKDEWKTAWTEFLNEMSSLDGEQRLSFLKSFEIQTDQEDLEQIIDSVGIKLSEYFKVDINKTIQLYQNLCFALMTWTTTLRKEEEITKEDLLQALSLASDDYQGIYHIPTNEPFFQSRIEFVNGLEELLYNREYPIVFLHGNPGTGKTNIVSHLVNKTQSVITLRFYAFKPLTSEEQHLTADAGVSSPRALWSDLLIQLRQLLKGKLAKYHVPVSNELISTVDELRAEVMRLSISLASETNKTTVIVIDGIDHAARSGKGTTFLQTLIPAGDVPKEICFLIVGQPTHDYEFYPTWLTDDAVLSVEVPPLKEEDIFELYNSSSSHIPSEDSMIAVKIINNHSHGNTLSVIFAVQEAQGCGSIEQLETRLKEVKISNGISSYYEYIWKSAINNIPNSLFYVDMILAGVLSLISKRINANMIDEIYGDESINAHTWDRILQKMYPIVIEEEEGYRVFHNDVRVYLGKYLKGNKSNFIEISSKIANYYILKSDDIVSKHELIFNLLDQANRTSEYINIFTTEYVMEAFEVGGPIEEIMGQLNLTLQSLTNIDSLELISKLIYPVATLYQFFQSMQWADKQYKPAISIQDILDSEKRVKPNTLITTDDLIKMLIDVNLLIEEDEIERANSIIINWIGELGLEDILDIIIENDNLDKDKLDLDLGAELGWIFKTIGEIYQIIGCNINGLSIREELAQRHKLAIASYTRGWLKKARLILDEDSINRTMENVHIYFKDDLESYLKELMNSDNVKMVVQLTKSYKEMDLSSSFNIGLAAWAIINGQEIQYKDIITEITSCGFNYYDGKDYQKDFNNLSLISFILSNAGTGHKDILESFLCTYRDGKSKYGERDYHAAHSIILVSIYLGFMCKCSNNATFGTNCKLEHFERNINMLLDEINIIGRSEINSIEVEKYLLKEYIKVANDIGGSFTETIYRIIREKAQQNTSLRYVDIYWEFLNENRDIKLMEEIFDYWMSEDGAVWSLDLGSIIDISEGFIDKAHRMGWSNKVEKSKVLLNQKYIGYTGHKEYSLYTPLRWFKRLQDVRDLWKDVGIDLLNISKIVSNLGDNRAAASIHSTISESAGITGYESLWEFSNIDNHWDATWIRNIFDGIISSLEKYDLSNEELIKIWKIATKYFYIRDDSDRYNVTNNMNKIYIGDIKTAIILSANRLGHEDISDEMKKIDNDAFELERLSGENHNYIISKRWFEDNTDNNKTTIAFNIAISQLSIEESYELLLQRFEDSREDFRWDFVVEFIHKVKRENRTQIYTYTSKILKLLSLREISYYWGYDGINRAYEAIIPYLETEELQQIFNSIRYRYFTINESDYGRMVHQLNTDLEDFTYFYYEKLSQGKNIEVLKLILDMHKKWLTGNRRHEINNYYDLPEKLDLPTSWMDFYDKLEDKLFPYK